MTVKNFLITIFLCFGFYLYQGSKKVASKSFEEDLRDPKRREETLAEMEDAMSRVMEKQNRNVASQKNEIPTHTMEDVITALNNEELSHFSERSEMIRAAESLNQPKELEDICFRELDLMASLDGFQNQRSAPLDLHIHQVLTSLSTTMEKREFYEILNQMKEETPSQRVRQILEVYLINIESEAKEVP